MRRKILAHASIVMGLTCFVLFVVDKIKAGAMSFINNDITKAFICVLSILAIVTSVVLLITVEKEEKRRRAKQKAAARKKAETASSARRTAAAAGKRRRVQP